MGIQEYITKLLAIQLPKQENELNSIFCFSLESFKYIHKISITNEQYLKTIKSSYMNHIKHITKKMKINPDLLTLSKRLELNYILLRDNYKIENNIVNSNVEWEILLYLLLEHVNLEGYLGIVEHIKGAVFKKSIIEDLLMRLEEYPELFIGSFKDENIIKLVGRLLNMLIHNGQITVQHIGKAIRKNETKLKELKEESKKGLDWMNNIQKELNIYKLKTKAIVVQLENKIIPILEAKNIIESKEFLKFYIDSVTIQKELKKSEFYREEVFRLSLEKNKKSIKNEATRSNCSSTGRTIDDFIKIYGDIPKITKLITRKEDPNKLIDVLRDFILLVKDTIELFQEPPLSNKANIRRVMFYIENYIITELYALY